MVERWSHNPKVVSSILTPGSFARMNSEGSGLGLQIHGGLTSQWFDSTFCANFFMKKSPRRDSNPQSLPPEGSALSIRPQGLPQKSTTRGDRTRDQSIKSRTLYLTELARQVEMKTERQRRDSNSRGRSPVDFESTSLTTRTRCQCVKELHVMHLWPSG